MTLDERKVYLMDSGDFTKIGYSTDPEARLSSAQSGNPLPIRLAGVIETNHAPRLEEKLHQLLVDYRCEMGGGKEWFDLPEDIHDVLAGTLYLSAYTLELRRGWRDHELEPDDPLLYADSVSIVPAQTREEYRKFLRSAQERKDRIHDQQRAKQHTTICAVCDTEGPSAWRFLSDDVHLVDKALAKDLCRECAEDVLKEAVAQ